MGSKSSKEIKENPRFSPIEPPNHFLFVEQTPELPKEKEHKFEFETSELDQKPKEQEQQEQQIYVPQSCDKNTACIAVCEKTGKLFHPCILPLQGINMRNRNQNLLISEIWERKWQKQSEVKTKISYSYFRDAIKCFKVVVYRVAYKYSEINFLLCHSKHPFSVPLYVIQQVPEEINVLTLRLCSNLKTTLQFEVTGHSLVLPKHLRFLEPTPTVLDILFQYFQEQNSQNSQNSGSEWKRDCLFPFPLLIPHGN
jgi:hypothetical protein